ncbi:hypothetical protein MMC13_007576 [Lambiella insularis]|nr:hypothetical protein [Lambiella insularis]
MSFSSSRWHFSPKFGGTIELALVDPSVASRLHREEYSFEHPNIDKIVKKPGRLDEISSWWESKVSVILPRGADVRDHFALERTFLGHLRTSLALAECSVIISQFFVLSTGAEDPMVPEEVRFRKIGRLLSCALLLWAIVICAIGAFRFLRLQDALVREEAVIDSGWELHIEGIGVFIVRLQTPRRA